MTWGQFAIYEEHHPNEGITFEEPPIEDHYQWRTYDYYKEYKDQLPTFPPYIVKWNQEVINDTREPVIVFWQMDMQGRVREQRLLPNKTTGISILDPGGLRATCVEWPIWSPMVVRVMAFQGRGQFYGCKETEFGDDRKEPPHNVVRYKVSYLIKGEFHLEPYTGEYPWDTDPLRFAATSRARSVWAGLLALDFCVLALIGAKAFRSWCRRSRTTRELLMHD
eukprot:gnl/TRDRNA2_/TRDRNA2_140110_c0_seq1.p1 gnl/TRDRNA2_/TRDRNA2_140110_c0~~gnl/TRDRNA2_/TRDRNA2_140110_c0_seq1.p1  ORF type:complete len:222 (+),score=13.58 gnl/TRDRNA2_/TRDRNA2_140110_c0_seq1:23-688(+)